MQGGHRRLVQILVVLGIHARFKQISISDISVQELMDLLRAEKLQLFAGLDLRLFC